jgi:hypothetical protein
VIANALSMALWASQAESRFSRRVACDLLLACPPGTHIVLDVVAVKEAWVPSLTEWRHYDATVFAEIRIPCDLVLIETTAGIRARTAIPLRPRRPAERPQSVRRYSRAESVLDAAPEP